MVPKPKGLHIENSNKLIEDADDDVESSATHDDDGERSNDVDAHFNRATTLSPLSAQSCDHTQIDASTATTTTSTFRDQHMPRKDHFSENRPSPRVSLDGPA
jgi:hypothetical protein